jgi:hypothetical protein
MRRLTQTSSYSYPRVTEIRIDVHPAGENPTNMTRTLPTPVHVRLMYASYGRYPYVATFHEPPTESDRVIAPEKKGSRYNPQHADWPIRGSIPSFSPEPTNKAVEKVKHLSTASYYVYQTHITGMRSVHSILAHGGNRTVLNWHRRGLQPWRCWLTTYSLPDLHN